MRRSYRRAVLLLGTLLAVAFLHLARPQSSSSPVQDLMLAALLLLLAAVIVQNVLHRGRALLREGWRPKKHTGILGSLIFHTGLVLLVIGIVIDTLFSFDAMFALSEGEHWNGDASMLRNVSAGAFASTDPFQGVSCALLDFEPRYRVARTATPSGLLRIQEANREGMSRLHVNSPYENSLFAVHQGEHWGYSVSIAIGNGTHDPLFRGFVRIATTFEKGRARFTDSIRLSGEEVLAIELFPNHGYEDGRIVSLGNDLQDPMLLVSLRRRGMEIFRIAIPPGAHVEQAGYGVSFHAVRYWSQFAVTTQHGTGFLLTGSMLCVLGLLLRLVVPGGSLSRRTACVDRGGGS
ncbi:MAG: cytochrome c biogenesis protein ResB [Bacteroidetes bacterium]|nr:cytochrome c biogenesis protein ResB [Bacteroidota bacterium]